MPTPGTRTYLHTQWTSWKCASALKLYFFLSWKHYMFLFLKVHLMLCWLNFAPTLVPHLTQHYPGQRCGHPGTSPHCTLLLVGSSLQTWKHGIHTAVTCFSYLDTLKYTTVWDKVLGFERKKNRLAVMPWWSISAKIHKILLTLVASGAGDRALRWGGEQRSGIFSVSFFLCLSRF